MVAHLLVRDSLKGDGKRDDAEGNAVSNRQRQLVCGGNQVKQSTTLHCTERGGNHNTTHRTSHRSRNACAGEEHLESRVQVEPKEVCQPPQGSTSDCALDVLMERRTESTKGKNQTRYGTQAQHTTS